MRSSTEVLPLGLRTRAAREQGGQKAESLRRKGGETHSVLAGAHGADELFELGRAGGGRQLGELVDGPESRALDLGLDGGAQRGRQRVAWPGATEAKGRTLRSNSCLTVSLVPTNCFIVSLNESATSSRICATGAGATCDRRASDRKQITAVEGSAGGQHRAAWSAREGADTHP